MAPAHLTAGSLSEKGAMFLIIAVILAGFILTMPVEAVPPDVSTSAASDIGTNDATLNGELNAMGSMEITSPPMDDTESISGTFGAGAAEVTTLTYDADTNFYVAFVLFDALTGCFASDNTFMTAYSPNDVDVFSFTQRGCVAGEAAWYGQVTVYTLATDLFSQTGPYRFRFNRGLSDTLTLGVSSWQSVDTGETPTFINGVDSGHPPGSCGTTDPSNAGLNPGTRGVTAIAALVVYCTANGDVATGTGTELFGISSNVCPGLENGCGAGSFIRSGTSHTFDVTWNPNGVYNSAGVTFHGTQLLQDDAEEDVYFEWGDTEALGSTTASEVATGPGAFAFTFTNLTAETTYFFRACASGDSGTSCGMTLSFTTERDILKQALDAFWIAIFGFVCVMMVISAWMIRQRING